MEVMDTCLDKFYKEAKRQDKLMPERILSRITFAVCIVMLVNGKVV